MTGEQIAVLIGAVAMAVGTFLTNRSAARKSDLEILRAVTEDIRKDADAVRLENQKQRVLINELTDSVNHLTRQLIDVKEENEDLLERIECEVAENAEQRDAQNARIAALEAENVQLKAELVLYQTGRKSVPRRETGSLRPPAPSET